MPEEIVSRILRLPGYRRMLCDQHEALRRARRTSHRLTDALRVIREQSQKAATQTYSIGENACGGRGGGSLSWFSVKMTAVGMTLRRTRAAPIAAVRVPQSLGGSRVALAALAG
jgi:hypothetical protein